MPNETEAQVEQTTVETKVEETSPAIDYDKLANILDGRQKATEETVLKGYFKDQGLSSEEVAQAIAAFKQQRAAQQPDVASMQASISQLQADIEKANSAATRAKVENVAIVEAQKLGISANAIPYLTRMADLSNVGDENGQVSAEKVAQALGKVLDDVPELKPQAQDSTGFRVGGESSATEQAPADDAKLRAAFGIKK